MIFKYFRSNQQEINIVFILLTWIFLQMLINKYSNKQNMKGWFCNNWSNNEKIISIYCFHQNFFKCSSLITIKEKLRKADFVIFCQINRKLILYLYCSHEYFYKCSSLNKITRKIMKGWFCNFSSNYENYFYLLLYHQNFEKC